MHKLLIASLLLIGCNKKKDSGASTQTADKPADPAVAQTADKPSAEPTDKPGRPPDASRGTCRVVASGAVTFEQVTEHTGGSMLNIFQWHSPETRRKMNYPDEGMILNCLGKDVRLNVMTRPKSPFPMKPGIYEAGTPGAGLFVTGQIAGKDGNLSLVKSQGSIEITEFDDAHIAGKGTITFDTQPATGESKLDISFDLKCYGLSGCKQ